MVEAHDGDIQAAPRGNGFPSELVRIARFDDIRLFPFQDLFHEVKLQKGPVT